MSNGETGSMCNACQAVALAKAGSMFNMGKQCTSALVHMCTYDPVIALVRHPVHHSFSEGGSREKGVGEGGSKLEFW